MRPKMLDTIGDAVMSCQALGLGRPGSVLLVPSVAVSGFSLVAYQELGPLSSLAGSALSLPNGFARSTFMSSRHVSEACRCTSESRVID